MKEPVTNGIEQQISSAGICVQSHGYKESVKSLDHSTGCHNAQNRLKNPGNSINGLIKQISLWNIFLLSRFLPSSNERQYFRIHLRHMISDHHLILAAAFHHSDNPIHVFDHFIFSLCLIPQLKAKPGDAVGQTDHIFPSSYIADNVLCQFSVLSHVLYLHKFF